MQLLPLLASRMVSGNIARSGTAKISRIRNRGDTRSRMRRLRRWKSQQKAVLLLSCSILALQVLTIRAPRRMWSLPRCNISITAYLECCVCSLFLILKYTVIMILANLY